MIETPATDQFTLQADRFSEAVRGVGTVPVSLETSVGNMEVIDALFRSAERGGWVSVGSNIQNPGSFGSLGNS